MNALLHSYLDMPNEHFIGFCLIISNSESFLYRPGEGLSPIVFFTVCIYFYLQGQPF